MANPSVLRAPPIKQRAGPSLEGEEFIASIKPSSPLRGGARRAEGFSVLSYNYFPEKYYMRSTFTSDLSHSI